MGLIYFLSVKFPIGAFIGISRRMPFFDKMYMLLLITAMNTSTRKPRSRQKMTRGRRIHWSMFGYVRGMTTTDALDPSSGENSSIFTPVLPSDGDTDETVKPSLG